MDRRIITLALSLLLCASPSWARMGGMMGMWGAAASGSSPSCLLCETFEGAGYSDTTGNAWVSTGAANPDCTTDAIGTQSLCADIGDGAYKKQVTGASGAVSIDFLVKFPTLNQAVNTYFFVLMNNTTTVGTIIVRSDGYLGSYHGSVFAWGNATISANTWIHVWIDYAKSTGGNGVMKTYWAAYTGSETKPVSPNGGDITTGDSMSDADGVFLNVANSDPGDPVIYDNVRMVNQ